MTDRIWRKFRTWPSWLQVVGWLLGWWLLISILAWRSSLPVAGKWTITGIVVVVFIVAVLSGQSPSGSEALPAPSSGSATATVSSGAPASNSPSPTPAPDAKSVIGGALEGVFDGETNWDKPAPRFGKVEVFKGFRGWVALVEINADDILTAGLTKDGIEADMKDAYKVIFSAGYKIRYASVTANFMLVNQFGKSSVGPVYETKMWGNVGSRINWNNVDLVDFGKVWEVLFLNQSFR